MKRKAHSSRNFKEYYIFSNLDKADSCGKLTIIIQ